MGNIFMELQNVPAVDIGAARDLQELHHPALPLDSIPPHVLPHLTHLELLWVTPAELGTFGSFLQQVSRLQSLTIKCSRQSVDLLLCALAQAQGCILRLTSLALIDQDEFRIPALTSGELQMLFDVFKQLPALRRFRTSFRCEYKHWAWFLDGLSVLKDLEVLGVEMNISEATTRNTINTWAQQLPSGFTALAITATTGEHSQQEASNSCGRAVVSWNTSIRGSRQMTDFKS
ncbi:uncharacterized protein B0H18DRAFT_365488 [Fomitopsis serialis]|uniref:uncharacterized protein n=1 Tax=Fomitopsis serialis TaxID=139415 RepID=UPI002008022D|nr:uncharacterized protein B0H18DRAFT_365488 [Neoantrodia serialis]KAH9925742.1 hypothetical protein B0H18DRAFT_365488 [Neoantrodia serialis]